MTEATEAHVDGGQLAAHHVRRTIVSLQERYLRTATGQPARDLAQLRRAAGTDPGTTPQTWTIEFESMPEVLRGKGPEPSRGEWAVHVALTLYAIHQQSQRQGMYVAGDDHGFGCAVRQLMASRQRFSELEPGEMPHRFAAMVTAQSIGELAHYARQIVGQLRSAAIPVDYPQLARELYWFQSDATKTRACLAWARGYSQRVRLQDAS